MASQCARSGSIPRPGAAASLAKTLRSGGKAVVLGRLNGEVADVLGLDFRGDVDLPCEWADCQIGSGALRGCVAGHYRLHRKHTALARAAPRWPSAPCADSILPTSGTIWGLAASRSIARPGRGSRPWQRATPLRSLSSRCPTARRWSMPALAETEQGAALWFNRPVGPVDSLEWRVVESFLGDYRPDDLPCFPYVCEIPAGYSAAVCARLDCDEAVGRPAAAVSSSITIAACRFRWRC